MASPDRTEVTSAATALRDMYQVHCTEITLAGDAVRRPALSVPQGPSTHGGLLARQHLTLEPEVPGAASLTVGWVDVAARRAGLRTFACLLTAHRARFGTDVVPVDSGAYERFLHRTRTFFLDQGISIAMEHQPPEVPARAARSPIPWRWLALACVVAVGAVAIGFLAS